MIASLFTTDHRAIGRRYLWLGLLGLLAGGALALLMRASLADPGLPIPLVGRLFGPSRVISPAAYTRLFTLHGTTMIFFAVTPIAIGAIGHFFIPLLVGAREMAFPRLGAASFWLQAVASAVLLAAALDPSGAAAAGWTGYAPLSEQLGTPGRGLTLWAISLVLAGLSSTVGAINFIVTILARRAPGMRMSRLPLTVWGLFFASILNALFVPVVAAAMTMLLADRCLGTRFFLPDPVGHGGGDPLVYQQLFWIFGHPEVYILILPTWGVVSDLLAWYSGRPAWGYRRTVLSLGAITVLSAVVYGHHMYATSMSPTLGRAFMTTTMLVSVPSTVLFLDWMGTLWGGRLRLAPAMLFSLGVMIVFAIGGLTGLYLASVPVDLYLHDTYFVVGHFHLTMAAAVFFGLFAAIYHFSPRLFGRALDARLGQAHFALTIVSLVAVFGLMLWMGHAGLPRRYYDLSPYETFRPLARWNRLATSFSYVLGAAQLLFVWNLLSTLARAVPAARPEVPTLEWSDGDAPVVRGPHEPDGQGGFLPQRGDAA